MVRENPGENLWRLNLGWVTAEELEQAPRYCPIFFHRLLMELISKSMKRYRYCVIVKLPPLPQGSRRRSVVRR